MKRTLALGLVLSVLAGWPGIASAQAPTAGRVGVGPQTTPTYNSVYCSGFIAENPVQEGLSVVAGEEGGVKNEFVRGDVVYLSHGAGWIVNPGGIYIVIRPMKDTNRQETFPGEHRLLNELGTMYNEVGRIRVDIVHEKSANAEVLQTCDSISVGDIAIPWNVKPAPSLKVSPAFDRFAPPSGKTGGIIAAAKEYGMILRKGDIGYLDIGAKQGVQVGQYFRVYRPFVGSNLDMNRKYRNEYPEKIYPGMRVNVHLTKEQQMSLPRDILGEAVVLHVEGRSATILVTLSLKDMMVGDQVELQ